MEEILKKALEKIYDKIRSEDDIHKEVNLSFDELIDKHYNLTDKKLPKNHICILRDVANNNNKEFDKVIEYYRNFSEDSKRIDFNTPCKNCDLKCCNNIDINFNFFAAVFVMDLWNRRHSYSHNDNVNLFELFLKQFYIEENKIKFNEDRMNSLFLDYDMEIIDFKLSKNDTVTNIKALLEIKNYLLSINTRYNNLQSEKIKQIETMIDFVNNKLEHYQNIHSIQKEFDENFNNKPFNFENNFDNVDERRVYNYFNESLVKRGYLSDKGLENFLILAFDKTKLPEEKLQFEKKHIGKIRKIFYKYYTEMNNDIYGNKMKYAELLGNYFNGFDPSKVYDNFDK